MNENENENPKIDNLKVPLWIKIMWVLGIMWVLFYIWNGLKNSPANW